MSDIGVAELPLADEEKLPLPPTSGAGEKFAGRRSDPAHAVAAGVAERRWR